MGRFIPDKHKRIRYRHEEKNHTQPPKNQPAPPIVTLTISNPKPRDMIGFYFVTPEKPVTDYKGLAERLAGLYGFDVEVLYEDWWKWFVVKLAQRVEYRVIEEYTLKALEEPT